MQMLCNFCKGIAWRTRQDSGHKNFEDLKLETSPVMRQFWHLLRSPEHLLHVMGSLVCFRVIPLHRRKKVEIDGVGITKACMGLGVSYSARSYSSIIYSSDFPGYIISLLHGHWSIYV